MPHLAEFLLIAGLIVITPGPDMAIVTKNALDGGRRAALMASLGTVTGLVIWLTASAVGIVAILRTSAVVFTAVKLCGAAYLLILGVQALLAARRYSAAHSAAANTAVTSPAAGLAATDHRALDHPAPDNTAPDNTATGIPAGGVAAAGRPAAGRQPAAGRLGGRRPPRLITGSPWRQGLMCNLLNPKIAILFTVLIPQFVTPGHTAAPAAAALGGIYIALTLVWLSGYSMAAAAAQKFLRRDRVQRATRAITGTALVGLGVRLAIDTR